MKVVAQGTGQALDTGRRGGADVVFVHATGAEKKIRRRRVRRKALPGDVIVVIGPKSNPAGVNGGKDIVAALKAIKDKGAPFISRGDQLRYYREKGMAVAVEQTNRRAMVQRDSTCATPTTVT